MIWTAAAGKIVLRVISTVIPQVGLVEELAKVLPALCGLAKEDAAVALAKNTLAEIEDVKRLLGDPEFEATLRAFVQAYVALQNAASKNTTPVPAQ